MKTVAAITLVLSLGLLGRAGVAWKWYRLKNKYVWGAVLLELVLVLDLVAALFWH